MSSKQSKKNKRIQAAKLAAAKQQAKPIIGPIAAKPQSIKCYEIHLQLINQPSESRRDIRQYFYQPKGMFQAIMDSLNFVHYEVERYLNSTTGKTTIMAVEEVQIYEWTLAQPVENGNIPTKRIISPFFEWNYENKLKFVAPEVSRKQKRRVMAASTYLDKYRPMRSKIVIEEIGQEIMDGLK